MKHNELKFAVKKHPPDEHRTSWLDTDVIIDGQPFGADFSVDIFAFAKSCQSAGEMDLFTCGCGVAACAGIFEGIRVSHAKSAIEWQCPSPLAGDLESDAEYPVAWQHFSFDPEQYASAVEECIGRLITLAMMPPVTTEFPVHGCKLEELIWLETRPFSARRPVESRTIIARSILVDAYADLIVVGGNSYLLSELRLPESLVNLNQQRMALHTYPHLMDELPHYKAYLEASRKFCSALRMSISVQ